MPLINLRTIMCLNMSKNFGEIGSETLKFYEIRQMNKICAKKIWTIILLDPSILLNLCESTK